MHICVQCGVKGPAMISCAPSLTFTEVRVIIYWVLKIMKPNSLIQHIQRNPENIEYRIVCFIILYKCMCLCFLYPSIPLLWWCFVLGQVCWVSLVPPHCQPLYTYINQLMRASGLTIHQEALLSYSTRADLGIVSFLFNRKRQSSKSTCLNANTMFMSLNRISWTVTPWGRNMVSQGQA